MTGKASCWQWKRLEFSIRRTIPDILPRCRICGMVSYQRDGTFGGRHDFWSQAPCCLSGMVKFCLGPSTSFGRQPSGWTAGGCTGQVSWYGGVSQIGKRQMSEGVVPGFRETGTTPSNSVLKQAGTALYPTVF